jgi:hypothetical protein
MSMVDMDHHWLSLILIFRQDSYPFKHIMDTFTANRNELG